MVYLEMLMGHYVNIPREIYGEKNLPHWGRYYE
jgi:hypothetical protein